MTESRKQPSQPAQADPQRQEFEAAVTQARQQLRAQAAPEGAQAMPSLRGIWQVLAHALSDSAILDRLWSLWKEWRAAHGGTTEPTPQPPAPPPEPAS
jgi:hypothetical protein